MPVWTGRPITELTDLDVLSVINSKKRTAPAQARNLLGIAKRMFGWTVDQRVYGLTVSPAERLKPTKIIGEKVRGDRIAAAVFWLATEAFRFASVSRTQPNKGRPACGDAQK
jgi:hypothetical protein